MQQLEHGTRRSETRSRPLAMEIVPREFLAAERGAQKVVLEGLEADVREEKVAIPRSISFELMNTPDSRPDLLRAQQQRPPLLDRRNVEETAAGQLGS